MLSQLIYRSLFLLSAIVVVESSLCGQEAGKAAEGLIKFSEKGDIWLDKKRNAVVVGGKICLREGSLEMFACPKGTKEHESVIAVNCFPQEVHVALVGMKAEPGSTVKFEPKYAAATGDIIDIFVSWKTADGKTKEVRAQDLVQQTKTGKPMAHDWVFAGSGFFVDEMTGTKHYQANAGDFICLSNFPTAMLDLPIESTDAAAGLLFQAYTENIPEKGTEVRLILVPRVKK